ncbi:MAG TPA: type II toxin-antitoxin system prevent-host-death family antitoxin [Solimonas sp.]|nr:type II toxin-antitoxin system prevent-host-death family antitoxin [Solimonas sp.]
MNKVSVVQAKAHFSEILAKVESGQDVLITRHGAPVARLSAVDRAKHPLKLDAIDAFRARLAGSHARSADLIRRMRDESY